MADLNDRGQIILVAAFAMAVTFVSLALVVNSAIYTENLASRGETSGSDDALVVRHEVSQSVGEAITYANTYNVSSEDTVAANISASVDTIGESVAQQQAATGKIVVIEGPTDYNNGTRIRDNTTGGSDFRNATGNGNTTEDWTVATSVDGTRAYRMTIHDTDGNNFGNTTDDEFFVRLTEGGSTWQMNVTHDNSSSEFVVGVAGPSGDGTCRVPETAIPFEIDLTAGLVRGEPCPPLEFGHGLGTGYDIEYRNGDEITGNYSIVVDGTVSTNNLDSGTAAGDDPYTTPAVYAVNVSYRYDGPALTYETTVRSAPGEPR